MYSNRIREYRKEIGLTMPELAKNAGISVGYLCHLEQGTRKNPSTEVMGRIANVLGKRISEVFFTE